MNTSFNIKKEIRINANKSELWKTLTTPALIKRYLMGANATSEWKMGSKIIYQGVFNGIEFRDEGVIDILDYESKYQYSYWSKNHGTDNIPENYVTISYLIVENDNEVILKVNQSNYKLKEIAESMNQIWDLILGNLKTLLEKKITKR